MSSETAPPRLEPLSPAVLVAVGGLGLLALMFLAWPVWRATLPIEIWGNEAWNAYHADAAFTAGLYPPPDGLVANNYPPLSYYLMGALGMVFGDPVYVGRVISLIAMLVVSACAAAVVLRFGAGRIAATVAAFWFLGTMAHFFDSYVGMNEPQLLAHAVMNVGLVWFLARKDAGLPVEPAVLLMVLASFFKHNIVVVPVAALLWLSRDNIWLACRAALTGAAAVTAGLAILAFAYPDFIANMLMPRYHYLARAIHYVGRTQYVLPALIVWGVWAWRERTTPAARFSALLIGLSILSYFVQKSGRGVDENAQFDLVFATAVGVGIAFDRLARNPWPAVWSARRAQLAVLTILLVRLIASTRLEFAYVLFSPEYRALAAERARVMQAEAVRVAAIASHVTCTNTLACRMAGKPFVFDYFNVTQMIETGRFSHADIAAKMSALGLTIMDIDRRASATSLYRRF